MFVNAMSLFIFLSAKMCDSKKKEILVKVAFMREYLGNYLYVKLYVFNCFFAFGFRTRSCGFIWWLVGSVELRKITSFCSLKIIANAVVFLPRLLYALEEQQQHHIFAKKNLMSYFSYYYYGYYYAHIIIVNNRWAMNFIGVAKHILSPNITSFRFVFLEGYWSIGLISE